MKRLLVFFAALCALSLFHNEALASHFRYGTISWVRPDPQAEPNTVKFTVTYAIVAPSAINLQDITLDFGDGSNTGPVVGAVIGTGTDAGGQPYEVRELTATHAYAAAGTYTAFFVDCCRITALVNGGGGNAEYRIDTKVVLQPGNTSGPVSASPALIQLQLGATRTYTWPAFDPDGDPVTCRLGTAAETGFPNPVPVVPNPPGPGNGGQSPALATVMNGCQLSWDLIDAQAGQRYVVHVIFESTHDGQISSTALDLIAEVITPPPPECAGTGVFVADAGQPFSAILTGTQNLATELAVSTINAPASFTLMPGGTGPSPFANTFSWTPQAADAGTTIVVVNYTNVLNHTGSCFLTIQVPECADYGDSCTVGVGQCAASGTNVCAGPAQTVCNATPGSPEMEVCDGLDNDCDGVNDDGDPGGGASCLTGLAGICDQGTTACDAGAVECVPSVQPGAEMETCDGEDDDCDGAIDDGFDVGGACSNGVGACQQAGAIVCDGSGGATCDAVPGVPAAEICGDGVDQDCDGVVNNGCADTDGDGLLDEVESGLGTDPNDADSDDDGVSDGEEPSFASDTDGDGLINALDPDSDDDGLFDGTELGLGCSDPATDAQAGHCAPDGDMGATVTDPLDADTDDGGVSDGDEDEDHDGVVDPGESDPTIGHGDDDIECLTDSDCGDAQSGLVCDPATNECEEGCHTPGNGCPSDEVCTSADETIGQCVECVEDAHCGSAQSGVVCDLGTNACIQGCRDDGNGCPDGQTCSIPADQGIGECAPDEAEEPELVVAQGGGLLCATRPANDDGSPTWLLTLAIGGLLAARRRRR